MVLSSQNRQKLHYDSAFSAKYCTVLVQFSYLCIGKVEKVYLDNTSLAYLLGRESTDIGNIRETFFYNQMRVTQEVVSSRVSDFEIDGRTFEVGGKRKGKKQIADAAEGYIVKDDIEYGSGNIIPLWAFGLTY